MRRKFPLNGTLLVFVLLTLTFLASGQKPADTPLPDYAFPVAGSPPFLLSGNFAELRPTHFHAGIDVKIGGRSGAPILAISDGYIERIKTSSFGYGLVIYLRHEDGNSSVYAHLDDFSPQVKALFIPEHYAKEENDLEFFPEAGSWPIQKGDLLGYGGNTGSSAGPHLHFEIRDSLERPLDPLRFYPGHVRDAIPPSLLAVTLVPLSLDSRVNGRHQRLRLPLRITAEGYAPMSSEPIVLRGPVGIEIFAQDKMNDVHHIFGVPQYQLEAPDLGLCFHTHVQHVDYSYGRQYYLHTHLQRYTKLFRLNPANRLPYYGPEGQNGVIHLPPGLETSLLAQAWDGHQNQSVLRLEVRGEQGVMAPLPATQADPEGDWFTFAAPLRHARSHATVLANGMRYELAATGTRGQEVLYHWPLALGVPDAYQTCADEEAIATGFLPEILPGTCTEVFGDGFQLHVAENSLLSPLYLRVIREAKSLRLEPIPHQVLNEALEWRWQQESTVDAPPFQVYERRPNGQKSYVGGEIEGQFIRFKSRNFGTFVRDRDLLAPSIEPIRVDRQGLRFRIRDADSGIARYTLKVDGRWVRMRYEHKQALIWTDPSDKQVLQGAVQLTVTDRAGNEQVWNGMIP
ncbi:MAG: M23 family metallopeptidase [Nitritalea sp.]